MRMSLIVAPPYGSDSSQAPVQRSLILTPNKYRKSVVCGLRVCGDGRVICANCRVRTPKATKQNQQKRNSTHNTECSFQVIRCHFGPLLFALVFAPPSCIGARTLHLSRHLASVFAPCMLPLQLARITSTPWRRSMWTSELKKYCG